MRDHGGDLDQAKATYGGENWIDLSTGINRLAYAVPDLPLRAWAALPTPEDITNLKTVAAGAYGCAGPVMALASAQAAIQMVPRLSATGHEPFPIARDGCALAYPERRSNGRDLRQR
jgi:cobalamin biosynthetic protein CobC